MKKRMLWKDIIKCFSKSKGRFISIFMLMMLGSFALVGLKVTSPNIQKTGIHYFKNHNLSDLTVIGSLGIDKENKQAIEKLSGTKQIEFSYFKDVQIKNKEDGIRIFSTTDKISTYDLVSGKNPSSDNEIVLSNTYKDSYKLGDVIQVEEKSPIDSMEMLKKHKFTVVGFAKSPEYLSWLNMGQSTAGTGELKGYGFVNSANFNDDFFTIARITFNDTKEVNPFSDKYTNLIQEHKNELKAILKGQPELRLQTLKEEFQSKIDEGKEKLTNAKAEFSDKENQLANASSKIKEAKDTIENSERKLQEANEKLKSGEDELNQKRNQLQSAKNQLDNANKKLLETKTQLDSAKQELVNAHTKIDNASVTLSSKEQELMKAKNLLVEKKQQLEVSQKEFEAKKNEYLSSCEMFSQKKSEYENALSELNSSKDILPTEVYEQKSAELAKSKIILDETENQLSEAKTKLDTSQSQLTEFSSELSQKENELGMKEAELNKAKKELKAQTDLLSQKETEYNNGTLKYQAGKSEYEAKEKLYLDNLEKWNVASIALKDKKKEYQDGISKLSNAKEELRSKETEYQSKLEEFNQKRPNIEREIADKEKELSNAQDTLNNLDLPTYDVNTRRETIGSEGYKIYSSLSRIVNSLANIFPIFLYFIASLVTLTTMTRFVDEERVNSGTLKALGYSDNDVVKKFTVYGLIAGVSGTLVGTILGHILIPNIVYGAYGKSFDVPKIELYFYPKISLIAMLLALVSTVLPAYFVARKELKDKPSALLLPKAPAKGEKILLERIPFVWNRLSFTHKVTARNIFRYKKRMLMTIFGVCGAVSLIFAGLSVQHSISGINERQFGEIIKYDMIVVKDTAHNDENGELDKQLSSNEIKQQMPIHYETLSKVAGKNKDKQEIKLIVTRNPENLDEYISLYNRRTDEKLQTNNNGAVISERLANVLGVKVGDTITVDDANNKPHKVKIANIAEMYMGHFMFMTDSYYEKNFDKSFKTNAVLVDLKDGSIKNTEKEASEFMEINSVKSVVQNLSLEKQVDTIVHSLNKIMSVLIIVAVLLGIVILYNLTNINILERIRELSTIKVLGFYDNEVTMYIYRETILLSLIGILAGFGVGSILHSYILDVVPPTEIMFNPSLGIMAFIIPSVLIAGITVVLGYIMFRSLKKLDMLSALKSVE